ncbi:unnamed protein product [Pedinophyceae sp. YPF-701]|nr:unnamed protein product [Pedinophyceae sp. YPF-701]
MSGYTQFGPLGPVGWAESGDWMAMFSFLLAMLPYWICGAVMGMMLPRPRRASMNGVLRLLPQSGLVRRLALVVHALVIVREVWCYFTSPGTFRAYCRALYNGLTGRGWSWPKVPAFGSVKKDLSAIATQPSKGPERRAVDLSLVGREPLAMYQPPDAHVLAQGGWYIDDADLAFFKYRAETDGEVPGAGDWEGMMDKELGDYLTYRAVRRRLPSGKTEYRSVTVVRDATAEEMTDFYLDDPARVQWDSLLSHAEVLEQGDMADRRQVVKWVRTFPFSFIKQREYCIARRVWKGPAGTTYTISKSMDHPRAPESPAIVRCETLYSMWRCRTIPCPWGSPEPACEVVLLHHEDFKIPERLARFAVSHGMWGFVQKLAAHLGGWREDRRTRVPPAEPVDPGAFGAAFRKNPLTAEELGLVGGDPALDAASDGSSVVSAGRPRAQGRHAGLRRLGGLLAVGGAAAVMAPASIAGISALGAVAIAARATRDPQAVGSKPRRRRFRLHAQPHAAVAGAEVTGNGPLDSVATFEASSDASSVRNH